MGTAMEFLAPPPQRKTSGPLTIEETRRRFAPPKTLGASEDVQMAMDEALYNGGVYSLLQHTFDMGQMPMPQFMGYGALQIVAQNGLIRACIGTVADDMTRNWIEIQKEGGPTIVNGEGEAGGDSSGLVTKLASKMEDFQLQQVFHEAVELAGYEGGALVFIDTGEANVSLPLNLTPQSRELRPGGRLRFVALDPVNVFPGNYNSTNPLKPDYYKPIFWWILGQKVHASRLLRVVGNEVPVLLKPAFNFLGLPQAQILWDYVMHFQECRSAVSRLLTKFSLTVFKTAMFEGRRFGLKESGVLEDRVRYMIRNMTNDGVLAVDKDNEDVVKLETPLSGCVDIVRQALEFLAAINRTPAVKLLGISPSGFNATGESDLRNYYDHIAAMQKKMLLQPLRVVMDCLQLHVAGRIDPTITFDFRPLNEEDKSALASLRKTTADTLAVFLDRDVISTKEARKRLTDDPDSGFTDLEPDDLPEPSVTPADIEALPDYTETEATNPAERKIGEAQAQMKGNPQDSPDPQQPTAEVGDRPSASGEGESNGTATAAPTSTAAQPQPPQPQQPPTAPSDSAEPPQKVGEDEEIWRTSSTGRRYTIDTETGLIVKGYIGQDKWQ